MSIKLTLKHTRVVSTKCTPGFACRAYSDTTLVCFIVNEHTTKFSRYIDGILPKGPYPPCLRMADRALLVGYIYLNTVATRDYVGSILPGQTVNNGSPGADMTMPWTVMHELARVVGNQTQDPPIRNYPCGITISHNVTALYFLRNVLLLYRAALVTALISVSLYD